MDSAPQQQRTSRARVRSFTPFHQFLAVALALLIIGGIYFAAQGQAGTTVNTTLTGGTPGGEIDLTDGLVGHWTFDGEDIDWSTAPQIKDRSGQGNHGTIYYGPFGKHTISPGVLGQSFTFQGDPDGSGGNWGHHITVPYHASLNPTEAVTACTWVKKPIGIGGAPIHLRDAYFMDWDYGPTRFRFGINRKYSEMDTNTYPDDGEWHHVCGTYDRVAVKRYIDGVFQNSTATSAPLMVETNQITIGTRADRYANYLKSASLDDLRVYNRALSAEEIKRLYDMGATGKVENVTYTPPDLTDGLVGHWTFDGKDVDLSLSSLQIRDRSGSGNHATINNSYKMKRLTSGVLGQAYYLEGSADHRVDIPHNDSLSILNNNKTWALWFRTGRSTRSGLFRKSGAVNINGILCDINGEGVGRVRCYVHDNSLSEKKVSSPLGQSYNNNTWHHMTATLDQSAQVFKLFINGVEVSSTSTPALSFLAESSQGFLGVTNIIADPLLGALDDLRVYNRALSAEEVKRLYDMGATGKVENVTHTPPDLTDGLVGHWTFDGKDVDWSSTTAEIRDRSGNGNHGNAANMDVSISTVAGILGQALRMSATNDYITMSKPALLDLTTNYTLSAWVYRRESSAIAQMILTRGKTSLQTNDKQYWMRINSSGVLSFSTADGVSSDEDVFGIIPLRQWTHVVCVEDSGAKRCYIDGVQSGTDATNNVGNYIDSASFIVGALSSENPTTQNLSQYLDDVRIYNRALSADEVKRLYELGR